MASPLALSECVCGYAIFLFRWSFYATSRESPASRLEFASSLVSHAGTFMGCSPSSAFPPKDSRVSKSIFSFKYLLAVGVSSSLFLVAPLAMEP